MGKHAYLIMAHDDFTLLSKLLECLDYEDNAIYIHIDKKSDFNVSDIYAPKCAKYTYIERKKVSWGGYSQIALELDLLQNACNEVYDYYHLISGHDLPIKTQSYIHTFFDNQPQLYGYIGFSADSKANEAAQFRLGQYHFLQDKTGRNPGKTVKLLEYIEKISLFIQRKLKVNRLKNFPYKIYKGSNWFSIPHDMALYVLTKKDDIKKYFNYGFCVDEMFLQTILMNSNFKERIIPSTLREIDWTRGAPYEFQKADYPLLINSDCLFARKFCTKKDAEIIDMIYNKIIREQKK